jgi:hypothetical protein
VKGELKAQLAWIMTCGKNFVFMQKGNERKEENYGIE